MTPRCPDCAGPTSLEDSDPHYDQAVYTCRRYPDCPGVVYVGESDDDIMRRENFVSAPRRVRTLDEQFAPGWRGGMA